MIIINSFMKVANDRNKQKCLHMSKSVVQLLTYGIIPLRPILNYKTPIDNAIRFICFQKSHLTSTWSSARSLRSLGWEDPLEKGTAFHSSILAWGIPWAIHGVTKSQWLSDFTLHWTTNIFLKKEKKNFEC